MEFSLYNTTGRRRIGIAMTVKEVTDYLISLGDPEKALHAQGFFKTGKGEYGEGDVFLGIRVPVTRQAVKKYKDIPLAVAEELLQSQYHEVRLFALLLLVYRFSRKNGDEKEDLYVIYIRNRHRINNWDLVDSSAHYIVGPYLWEKGEWDILYEWVKSPSLWDRRIAVMTTFHFIRQGRYKETLDLCEILLKDRADLIHKATGWMLREIGNRDKDAETGFLEKFCTIMPRTMLRYAIEKFPPEERKIWLAGGSV